MTIYKGYAVEYNVYGQGEYSVLYFGDDYFFNSLTDAKKFIDEVTENEME